MATSSIEAYKPLINNMAESISAINNSVMNTDFSKFKSSNILNQNCQCCPPPSTCSPYCIATIERCAMKGEHIIVPFTIKNTCNHPKTYRIGIRELKDLDGKPAQDQPRLNKHSITLEPGRSIRVLLSIDLMHVTAGSTYTAEIVLRENNINQNICLKLIIDDSCRDVVIQPMDERKLQMRWQNWHDHYWCEPHTKNKFQQHSLKESPTKSQ